ncbi:hypothetical protein BABINDRAFT_42534 [Babjeviella inositovora NRRL Y-12698]|uniref:Ubiquitin-conjugating enzyme E2 1 n=1 Tax=Babjeviella inositovora NRRL Y-12698 TaxID=984486 RepID=A0A1E3QH53_9ASCO|nr:uncharacterized protein BABINDRAFT_42534 [Babjeviella inositovora NRRL Y-12698]ODQ76960.1 hypothetical protein BABINDRAFT_42534 [Babjeviella inositovora NRRL Y-12698]
MSRVKRITKELTEVAQDTSSGITLQLNSVDDLTRLTGYFNGPPDTPYQGGVFKIDITIPQEYPFKPPQMKFLTKIYHPNISSVTGAICLDILTKKWTPILTLKSVLISLQLLLQSPEPSDPQDAEVAKHYLSDIAGFNLTATYWTQSYAQHVDTSAVDRAALYGIDSQLVAKFEGMGFKKDDVVDVLRRHAVKKAEMLDQATENKVIESLLNEQG